MGTKENATMPWRNRTYTAIWQAVKSGKLKRGKCAVCGASRTQAHHRAGYSGTEGIVWLCDKHHRGRHVKKRQIQKSVDIIKSSDDKQLLYLIIAKPNTLDTDKQWFEEEDVELLAHRYAVRYFMGEASIYEEHSKKLTGVYLVETYIAPVDFTMTDHKGKQREIAQGTWIVGLWIPDEAIWTKVKSGEYGGGSVRGPARLTPGETPPEIPPEPSSNDDKVYEPVGV